MSPFSIGSIMSNRESLIDTCNKIREKNEPVRIWISSKIKIRGRGLERSLELRVFVSSSFFNTYSYRMLQITGGETFQSTLLSCGRASFTKYKRDWEVRAFCQKEDLGPVSKRKAEPFGFLLRQPWNWTRIWSQLMLLNPHQGQKNIFQYCVFKLIENGKSFSQLLSVMLAMLFQLSVACQKSVSVIPCCIITICILQFPVNRGRATATMRWQWNTFDTLN